MGIQFGRLVKHGVHYWNTTEYDCLAQFTGYGHRRTAQLFFESLLCCLIHLRCLLALLYTSHPYQSLQLTSPRDFNSPMFVQLMPCCGWLAAGHAHQRPVEWSSHQVALWSEVSMSQKQQDWEDISFTDRSTLKDFTIKCLWTAADIFNDAAAQIQYSQTKVNRIILNSPYILYSQQ